jgi:tRNA isopentenyl-2-thiomethyl-A-37 hydroxylase MiaE
MSLIFIWLDQRIGNLPGGNEKLKEKFRKLLSPIKQFDKPTICTDYIKDSIKDKRVLFLTTAAFAEEDFLRTIASLSNVIFIYIYDQQNKDHTINDQIIHDKMGSQRIIHFDERLYEQLVNDLVQLYQNEGDRFIKIKEIKQAKPLFQLALQLIDTVDEKDQDIEQIQRDLFEKIDRIK